MKMVMDLLLHMANITVLTQDQIDRGIMRVYGDMTEIVLDNPHAYVTLTKLVESCVTAGMLSQHLATQMPQRQVVTCHYNVLSFDRCCLVPGDENDL